VSNVHAVRDSSSGAVCSTADTVHDARISVSKTNLNGRMARQYMAAAVQKFASNCLLIQTEGTGPAGQVETGLARLRGGAKIRAFNDEEHLMQRHGAVTLLCVLSCVVSLACRQRPTVDSNTRAGSGKILAMGELTWTDIDALNRDRTLVLLTVGMLEEHGPHLPIGTDTFGVEYEAARVADRLSLALPDWTVLVMPTVHYGSSGANQIGNIAIHPGTYALRQSTLRSLIADVGGQIAQNRFKRIFVMNGHGAPTHHAAVNEACDFISETFMVTMLNISGLFNADARIQSKGQTIAAKYFSPADLSSFGPDVHAGVGETSAVLAVRPDLVRSSYRTLPSLRAETLKERRDLAQKPGWPGYFSSPARANADYGRDVEAWWVDGMTNLILQAVRGETLFNRPRWPEPLQSSPDYAQLVDDVLAPEREFEREFERWLVQRKR
jgi:creatinine amidohydrolase